MNTEYSIPTTEFAETVSFSKGRNQLSEASKAIFDSINTYADLQTLIDEGASENDQLECKAPESPNLGRESKHKLGQSVSGFANTGGGVIVWGMSTSKHPASNSDTLTQIVPIGSARAFRNLVDNLIPQLTMPVVTDAESKLIKRVPSDSRGVVITHIPYSVGNPIQVKSDGAFYMRIADGFEKMPYAILQRAFAAPLSPDVRPDIDPRLVTQDQNGLWTIAISLVNQSNKSAIYTDALIEVTNPESTASLKGRSLINVSNINPGKTIFSQDLARPLHKGLPIKLGDIALTMKSRHRIVKLTVSVYADQMRARRFEITINLVPGNVTGYVSDPEYLY